jgi:small nuclear ribonucleoprotein
MAFKLNLNNKKQFYPLLSSSSPQNNQSNILQGSLHKNITIKLKGKRTLKGKLKSFDQYMNLTLENASEILKEDQTQEMGDIFIKGENIVIIATD